MRSRVSQIVLLSVAAFVVLGASAYAVTRVVSSSASDAVRSSSANTNLSATGGANTTIVSVSLPAGSWVVTSAETAVNFGPSDYLRCGIYAGNKQISGNATMVGIASGTGNQGPGAYVASLSGIGSFTTTGNKTVSLECEHDNTMTAGPPYIDAGATLWAHKADSLG